MSQYLKMSLALIEMLTAGNGSTLTAQAAPPWAVVGHHLFTEQLARRRSLEGGDLGPLQKEARLLPGMRPTCVGWQWRQERFSPSHPSPDK